MSKKLKKGWRHLLTILQNGKMIKLSPGELQLQRSQTKQFTAVHGVLAVLWSDSAVAHWMACHLVDGHLIISGLFSKSGKDPGLEGWK